MSEAHSHSLHLVDFPSWESSPESRDKFVGDQAGVMRGSCEAHALIASNLIPLLRPAFRDPAFGCASTVAA